MSSSPPPFPSKLPFPSFLASLAAAATSGGTRDSGTAFSAVVSDQPSRETTSTTAPVRRPSICQRTFRSIPTSSGRMWTGSSAAWPSRPVHRKATVPALIGRRETPMLSGSSQSRVIFTSASLAYFIALAVPYPHQQASTKATAANRTATAMPTMFRRRRPDCSSGPKISTGGLSPVEVGPSRTGSPGGGGGGRGGGSGGGGGGKKLAMRSRAILRDLRPGRTLDPLESARACSFNAPDARRAAI